MPAAPDLPRPNLTATNPSRCRSATVKNYKVSSLARIQASTISQAHEISDVLRDTSHSFHERASTPFHQVPDALVESKATANQSVLALHYHFIAFLDLMSSDLSIPWIRS